MPSIRFIPVEDAPMPFGQSNSSKSKALQAYYNSLIESLQDNTAMEICPDLRKESVISVTNRVVQASKRVGIPCLIWTVDNVVYVQKE